MLGVHPEQAGRQQELDRLQEEPPRTGMRKPHMVYPENKDKGVLDRLSCHDTKDLVVTSVEAVWNFMPFYFFQTDLH